MAQTVEVYVAERTITVAGRTLPASFLYEDSDGLRLLVLEGVSSVPLPLALSAGSAGASALVVPEPATGGWYVLTVERFIEHRVEDRPNRAFMLSRNAWRYLDAAGLPEYADVLRAFERMPDEAPAPRMSGFVHLHTHSEYSALDGLSRMSEIVAEAARDEQPAVAITDHGTCAGHPDLAREAGKAGLKPVFGMEGNFVPFDRRERLPDVPPTKDTHPVPDDLRRAQEERKALGQRLQHGYKHLVLWAESQEGLRNLWALSTEAYRDGFYYRPRFDWDSLQRHSSGLLVSTACLRGPLSDFILADDEGATRDTLMRMLKIFDDRLYLEVHANQLPEQKRLNEVLVRLGREYGIPLVGVVDSHYPTEGNHVHHEAWLACQTQKDVADDTDLFAVNLDLFMQTEAQVRERLAYLGPEVVDECVANTVAIAERCDASVKGRTVTPVFSKVGVLSQGVYQAHSEEEVQATLRQVDADRLLEACLANWHLTEGKRESQEVYLARFEREFNLLKIKGFCGYFLIVMEYVADAKEGRVFDPAIGRAERILVGPGRGSGGGSLVAYLCGITGIDPVDADLLFERFMTEGRTALPDFDVDFPSSKKLALLNHVRARWGEDFVITVGTHMRMKNKGTVNDLTRALKSQLPETAFEDGKAVNRIIDAVEAGEAGLGISWEDLWIQHEEDLGQYRERYPRLYTMADVLVGRLKTYGKHAAGIVISTEDPLTDTLPLRSGDEEDSGAQMVSQFAMEDLEALGLVKFDILVLRTLDTIQVCVDIIREQTGREVDPYAWTDEYEDPFVWEQISEATLGIFQIETNSGTGLMRRYRPTTVADLANVITLVRPGPVRSGLTDTYLRRKAGLEPVTYPDPRMETVLDKTYGCLLYQEDIMNACIVLGGYPGDEADKVRKILGKKQVEKVAEAGVKFVAACVERGMAEGDTVALWDQMAEFAKYSFNRAHAYAYAVIGYWCAWLKFHYPAQFITAALSTVKDERVPEFVKESRQMGYRVLPPDINDSVLGFRAVPGTLAIRYGMAKIKGIGEGTVGEIVAAQPFSSYEDFRARTVENKGSKVNAGHVMALAKIGAFDSLGVNRRGLIAVLEGAKSGESSQCVHKVPGHVGPRYLPIVETEKDRPGEVLPCTYDWADEPVEMGRTGKPLKPKPLPKKCTKACRHYTAPEALTPDDFPPFSPEEIEDIEMRELGVYLTSTPFERLPEDLRADALAQAEGCVRGQFGVYHTIAQITGTSSKKDRRDNTMGWLNLSTEYGDMRCVAFSDKWEKYRTEWTESRLPAFVGVAIRKTDRGLQLESLVPLR